jgi:hypothetical protein
MLVDSGERIVDSIASGFNYPNNDLRDLNDFYQFSGMFLQEPYFQPYFPNKTTLVAKISSVS